MGGRVKDEEEVRGPGRIPGLPYEDRPNGTELPVGNPNARLAPISDKAQLRELWPVMAQILAPALEYAAGRWTLESALEDLLAGNSRAFLVLDPEEHVVYAVVICEINQYPERRVFNLAVCAGQTIAEWQHLWPAFCQLAVHFRCDQIEVTGRAGWKRYIPGAVEVARTYVMDLVPSVEVPDGEPEKQEQDEGLHRAS